MSLRKKVIMLIIASIIITPKEETLAYDEIFNKALNSNSIYNSGKAYREGINTVTDVFIDGIHENSILYVGADIVINGYVNEEAIVQEISWQLTGDSNIVDFDTYGNRGKITARAPGTVWVMARATDGSDKAREYAVKVEEYPEDTLSKELISNNITPIQKRTILSNINIIQVEVNKNIQLLEEKVSVLEDYIKNLATLGTLSNGEITSDEDYEYYIIDISGRKVEVRVDKKDDSYSSLKNILLDVSKYIGDIVDTDKEEEESAGSDNSFDLDSSETTKPPENDNGSGVDSTEKPKDEDIATPGGDNIVVLGGDGTSEDNPIIVTTEDKLTSEEKVDSIRAYLMELETMKQLYFIRKFDTNEYTSYIFKVSEKSVGYRLLRQASKNDFYIEIRVNKNDEESYKPIIEMLEDIATKDYEDLEQDEKEDSESATDIDNTIGSENEEIVSDKEESEENHRLEEQYYASNGSDTNETLIDNEKESLNVINDREVNEKSFIKVTFIVVLFLLLKKFVFIKI